MLASEAGFKKPPLTTVPLLEVPMPSYCTLTPSPIIIFLALPSNVK